MTLKDVYMSGIFNDDTQITLIISPKGTYKTARGRWYEDKIQYLFVQYINAPIEVLDYHRKENWLYIEVTA